MIAIDGPIDVGTVMGALAFAIGVLIVTVTITGQITRLVERINRKRKK